MAFDGIVVASLVHELRTELLNGRISKIAQPENDALLFTFKGSSGQIRLLLSASASLPLVYLTKENRPSPLTAPNFCMLLRKHIANGRIVDIYQPGLERIICFEIEHLDEMGDLCRKKLYIEIMGKHSNIIFCTAEDKIIDSIKHVSAFVSSVREVLPGRDYFIPDTMEKKNPLDATSTSFVTDVCQKGMPIAKAIYTTYTGFSPCVANELCYISSIDPDMSAAELSEIEQLHLANQMLHLMEDVKGGNFSPIIVTKENEPIEFSAVSLKEYSDFDTYTITEYETISEVLESYYAKKDSYTRIRQKSSDLRRVVSTALDRDKKKLALQEKQMKDTEKREKYKVYGELINTYGYNLAPGAKHLEALNYYNNEMIKIPLDDTLTPQENAQKYFAKYNKQKRTFEALTSLIEETRAEINYLETVVNAMEIAVSEDDLHGIKEELVESGFIKRRVGAKGQKIKSKSKPFHYRSSDGFDMYVGKNNLQNEELTFKVANGNDWWFHAKGRPGSHVIVKTEGKELPDRTFEEAGMLAGYYSSGRDSDKIEIDYLQRKNVKKPSGAAPGFVVYYTNYSLTIKPDISSIEQLS